MYKRARYSKYGRKSSLASRTAGQFRSAKKTNDSLQFVINTSYAFTTQYDPVTEYGTAAINIWEVLANNNQFYNLKNMYDQVRIDGINGNLNVNSALVEVGGGTIGYNVSNLTVYTAWDRTGLSQDELELFTASTGSGIKKIEYIGTDPLTAVRIKIGSKIVNKTGAEKTPLNIYQRWRKYIYMYPQLSQEKTQYIQTGDINKYIYQKENNKEGTITIEKRFAGSTYGGQSNSSCPTVLMESSTCRFKPTLLVGVFSTATTDQKVSEFGPVPNPVTFTCEFKITCTFRNLKGAS